MKDKSAAAPQAVQEDGNQIIMTQVDYGMGPEWQSYSVAYLPILHSYITSNEIKAEVICWSHFEDKWVSLEAFVETLRFVAELWS